MNVRTNEDETKMPALEPLPLSAAPLTDPEEAEEEDLEHEEEDDEEDDE